MHPTILAVDPDPAFAQELAAKLTGHDVRHAASLEVAGSVLGTFSSAIVVIGPDIEFEDGLELLSSARAGGTNLGAVVVARRPTTRMMRQAMYADVADVLTASYEDVDLIEAIRRAAPATSAAPAPGLQARAGDVGQVVTVFSAKGGSGKSMVAANVAVLLAQRGHRVCVLDLDLQFGDAAIMFQLQPSLTIQDAVQSFDELDAEDITDFVTVHDCGVAVLAAPLKPDQAESIAAEHVAHVIELLRQAYEWVVIDTPAMFTDQTLAAIDAADRLVVLSSFDVPSIKNLRLGLHTLRELGVDAGLTDVVMVRADAKVGLRMKEVERTIGTGIDIAIPSDREVTISLNHGIPLALERPRSAVVAAISQLTDRITGTAGQAPRATSHALAQRLRRPSHAQAPAS